MSLDDLMLARLIAEQGGVVAWEQRARAAVLFYWPAALAGDAALCAHGVRVAFPPVVRVAVDGGRSVRSLPGVRVERVDGFSQRAQMHLSPPRIRLEEAVLHFRDVEYVVTRTIVELDGRLGHEGSDRWADLDRDLDAALAHRLTLRLGWGQVLDPCRLASTVSRILVARGWRGRPRACRDGCPVDDVVHFPAPGAGGPTESWQESAG